MSLIIGTRKSKLAQWQADRVIELLKEKYSSENFEKLLVVTEGDKRLDVTLDKIGGKGLFVKEIELSLLNKTSDAAVHSMKDVPYDLGEDFSLVAIPERNDIRDAFVSKNSIHFKELRKGARIGTSSIRRAAQLKLLRDDLEIVPIRGNVQTRISKIESENLDGIILAAAGLKRLELEDIITDYFDPKEFLPAVGQGALGIECLKDGKNNHYFKSLDNQLVRMAVEAERSFMKELNGGCHSLIGVYSEIKGNEIYLIGTYEVNGKIIKKDILGDLDSNIELGKALGRKIITEI
ncbi:MAG: hydroxymethylbilane synthase [Sarcina sp.]